jgi:TIR domain
MPEGIIPEHVFISYSRKDQEQAQKVRRDIEAAGIKTWMDEQIEPGTPVWESAIRNAIARSFAVVLIASPHAKEGPYIRGELRSAESCGSEIIPIWIEGDKWIECVPMSLSDTQYIDCRGSHYDAGLAQLVEALQKAIEKHSPKHDLLAPVAVEEYRTALEKYTSAYEPDDVGIVSLRSDYIYIKLGNGDIVAMRYTAYPTLRALLDDLYTLYLRDSYNYRLFTYGSQWLLGTYDNIYSPLMQLLVPWDWLSLPKDHSPAQENPDWSAFSPQTWFASAHLRYLRVLDKLPQHACGIVTNSARVVKKLCFGKEGYVFSQYLSAIVNNKLSAPKDWFGSASIVMERPEKANALDYPYHLIVTSRVASNPMDYVQPGAVSRGACLIRE